MSQLAIRTIETIAIEINSIKDHTKQIMLHSSIEIGRRLTEAKAMMQHGEWMNWLADSVDYKQSTANNLMKIFKEYGSDQLSLFGDNANSQALGNLNYTQAIALLGIPQEEREAFVEENDVDNMSTRELQEAVKARKEAEKALKSAEKELAAAAKREEKEKKLREMLEIQQADHALIVEKLKAQVEEAAALAASGTSEDDGHASALQESLDKTEQQLADSLAKIKELETEIKAKPIDIPVKEIIEKIPEDVEKELAELREQVKRNDNKALAKFSVGFETIVRDFDNLLTTLYEIKTTVPDEYEKYRKAVNGLIGRMSEKL